MKLAKVLCIGAILVFVTASSARARDDITKFFDARLGEQKTRASYFVEVYDQQEVEGQGTDYGLTRHQLVFLTPLYQDSDSEWLLSSAIGLHTIDTDARLPDTGEEFPRDLWNIRFGTTYRHRMKDKWIIGGNFNLGSASDKPFDSSDEMVLGATGFLRVPSGERSAWLMSVNYSNNREFLNNIPIPGIAYWYVPSKRFSSIIGIPFFIWWKPYDNLSLALFYFPVRNIRARIGYEVSESFTVFSSFQWANQRYFRSERTDSNHRLFYYEKRLSAGARIKLTDLLAMEIAGGYAFDRFYFEGEKFSDRSHNRLNIHDGPFAQLKINLVY